MALQIPNNIDEATRQRFESVCETIGVSPSYAISIFIKGVINHNGIPFSVLAPKEKPNKMSREEVFGCMRGQFKMADDFDAPLDDFKEYME